MTKYRTTDKEQRKEKYIIVGFGYCNIQNLTKYMQANAYTCGQNGWRADFYDFGNVALSTGYAPLTFCYDKRAKKILPLIKKEIEKLEKKIDGLKSFKNCYDWHKNKARLEKKIEKIIVRAFDSVPYEIK